MFPLALSRGATPCGHASKLLTRSPWKLTNIEWRDTNDRWSNQTLTAAQKLTTITFFENNTYSAYDGYGTGSGTWQLSADKRQVTVYNASGSSGTVDISADRLVDAACDAAGNVYTTYQDPVTKKYTYT